MKTPILLLIALVLVGCGRGQQVDSSKSREYAVYADTIHGHVYITTTLYQRAASTIHAEHCKCKEWK